MILLDTRGKGFKGPFARLENRFLASDPKIAAVAARIVADVRKNGDAALFRWTQKLDGLKLDKKTARVGHRRIRAAAKEISDELKQAMVASFVNILEFHAHQCEQSWAVKNGGTRVGQIIRPLRRVGLYVPGGTAAYPSSVLMNAAPAIVAGVPEIIICSPAPKGKLAPAVLFAAELCGIREFYQVGGAQAVAAMAYGTGTVQKVDKIVGPGNAYVAEAKRIVFGAVDIDMVAGPSEICIVADETANPAWCAADILSQAEHDALALPVFISHSKKMCGAVAMEVARQAHALERRAIAEQCLANRFHIIGTRSLAESVALADRLAPEHLQLVFKGASKVADGIQNAGAVFVGNYSPEALGDYLAGPNHVLPTSGSARFFSPLGVYDFIKRSSLIEYSKAAFLKDGPKVAAFARAEGLTAHAHAAELRLKK